MRYYLLLSFLILPFFKLHSQVKKLVRHKVQLGISSGADNSQHSHYILSNLSLHLLSGYTGAIQGFQISGISNRSFLYTNGLQLSAFSNVTGNLAFRPEKHVDFEFRGAQIGTLINKVEGDGKGLQLGVFNRVSKTFEGIQMGMFNAIQRGALGLQLGGIFNYAPKRNSMAQIGLFNYSFDAGLMYEKGFFFMRDHFQLGFMNITNKNHGWQIGLINLSKDNKGIPVGLINTSTSHGEGNLAANEIMNTYLTFSNGSKYLLNRLIVGYNYSWNKNINWTAGYGLELKYYKINNHNAISISHDILYMMQRNKKWNNGLPVSRISLNFSNDIFDKYVPPILIGISYNIGYFSNEEAQLDLPLIMKATENTTHWIGFDFGFKL
ncbi:hypothetical protein [Marivirga sp.]|uniref:hypothetical protein n=1 Tax=Marivirga sp. TaxID=2018662 RepID=UPI003DA789EF